MAQIILITAGDQPGEPERITTLGDRSAEWCEQNLNLEPDPIPLGTRIELVNSQHVFVKVDDGEKGPLHAGLYPSNRSPFTIREMLQER